MLAGITSSIYPPSVSGPASNDYPNQLLYSLIISSLPIAGVYTGFSSLVDDPSHYQAVSPPPISSTTREL